MNLNVAVLASGRGTNLQALIERSKKEGSSFKVKLVIADVEGAFCLQRAEEENIRNYFVDPKSFPSKKEFEEKMVERIKDAGCQLVCLAGYMRLLGKSFIEAWEKDIMNIHPSLLPSFTGLAAQQQALDYGVRYSGCTVHFVDEGMDTGAIIDQRVVDVYHTDDEDSLAERILIEEHTLYPEVVELYSQGKIIKSGNKIIINK